MALWLLAACIGYAQAPKVKHVYKDKILFDETGKEIKSEPVYYCDYSASGKKLQEKEYIEGSLGIKTNYVYNKKDSLVKKTRSGSDAVPDSLLIIYQDNSDTILEYYYKAGKKYYEYKSVFHISGKKSYVKFISYTLNEGYEITYDTSGYVLSYHTSSEDVKYDKFGSLTQYRWFQCMVQRKYSKDGKLKLQEEKICDQAHNGWKVEYVYNENNKLIKVKVFNDGYVNSNTNGVKKILYTDSSITTYSYNSKDSLTGQYDYGKGTTLTSQKLYFYDEKGQKIKEEHYSGTGKIKEMIPYKYDKYDNILEEIHYKSDKSKLPDWKYVYTYEFY